MEEKVLEIKERFEVEVGFEDIEARFLKTSNPRFQYYVGNTNRFKLKNMMAFFGSFHSSYIIQVYLEGNLMTITTRNSTYVFEILENDLIDWFEDGVLFELGYKEISILEDWLSEVGK